MYLHPLPAAPASVDFCSCLIPTSTSSISTSHLSKATQAREHLRNVLSEARAATAAALSGTSNSSNGSGGGVGAYEVKLVSSIDDYLPHLIAIYNGTQTDELVWRAEAWFSWQALLCPSSPVNNKLSIGSSSSSSSSAKHGPFASSSLAFELDHVLILYSLALSNLALLQSISVGNYEYSKVLMDSQRKEYENTLKRGVAFGKKAVEVVQWMMRDLDTMKASEADGRQDWNEEWQRSRRRLLEGLHALHQLPPTLLSLRLLLSPSTCVMTSTQLDPPPLPKGHPSPSLLAKLYLEIPRLVDEARLNLQSASGRAEGAGSSRKLFGGGDKLASGRSDDPSKLSSKFKRFGIGNGRKEREGEAVHRSVSPQEAPPHSSASTSHRPRPNLNERRPSRGTGTSSAHNPYPSPSLSPVSSKLFRYLDSVAAFCRSSAFKYLALSVGESGDNNGTGGRHAEAIVYLRMASTELEKLSDGPNAQMEEFVGRGESKGLRSRLGRNNKHGPSSSSSSPSLDRLEHPDSESTNPSSSSSSSSPSHPLIARLQSYHATLYLSHQKSLSHLSHLYKRLNDSVSFQPLPSIADLSARIPTPRGLLAFDGGSNGGGAAGGGAPRGTSSWIVPRPAFGPGSFGSRIGGGGGGDDGVGFENDEALGGGRSGGSGGGGSGGGNAFLIGVRDDAEVDEAGYVGKGAYY